METLYSCMGGRLSESLANIPCKFTLMLNIWRMFWIFSVMSFEIVESRNEDDLDHTQNLTKTLSQILRSYDVRLRPNFGADPLYVGIELEMVEINEFSEVNMDYTITLMLNQYWKDERLAFSTGQEMLTFTGDFVKRIWVPDIFFPADKDSFIHDVTEKNQMVQLQGDGSILYGIRFTTRESCQMDLRNFPLDSQNCSVEIESYGYTVEDLIMYWKEGAISGMEAIRLPQLRIVTYETTDRIETLATGIYQRLTLSITFERHFGFFFFQMYLPSILIVMLSWVSFWISNDATAARVALGITTVLTMTTINNSVRASLPRISYIKAIDVYLVICFLFVFAALIEYAAVNYVFWERQKVKKRKKKKKISKSMTKFLTKEKISKSAQLKSILLKGEAFKKIRKENESIISKGKCSIEMETEIESSSSTFLKASRPSQQKLQRIGRSYSFSGRISTERQSHGKSDLGRPKGFSPYNQAKERFMRSIKLRANALSPHLIEDVSSVDNYSRILFPSTFLIFNTIYWSIYANKT